mmetsp:Transcript_15900/g.30449  ORF Transcript_15900/g.30449 Transcript_15900/m.30449 type:complete len:333 (+) Transcript_15900:224-1222(+)
MSQGFIYGISAAITLVIQLAGFVVAYTLRTETFYDILGGLNYLTLAIYAATAGAADEESLKWVDDPRKIITTILFGCSRGWLLVFLAWRAHERKGDSRFDEVLGKGGNPPQPLNFFVFWMVQAMWVYLISMPMLFVSSSDVRKPEFSAYDIVWAILFILGVLIEIVADIQKALWVKNGRRGDFCNVGVWAYSRHPNYFGEIFQWWCLWMFSYSSSEKLSGGYVDPLWWVGIISPLFTMQILLNMKPTGLCNAEGQSLKRYYEKCPERYAQYRESTSILIPLIGYKYVPMFLKQTIFFDFEKYEYRPLNIQADENIKKENASEVQDYGSSSVA